MIAAIVTDIEGTTSSIDFVHQELFPYARRELAGFVKQHATDDAVRKELANVDALAGRALSLDEQIALLLQWIDEDRKATPLKSLQGMIWEVGYASGELRGHVYADVPPALRRWHARGLRLAVYSSGSEQAQRLIFGHSTAGDLTPLFERYFDTRIGAKGDAASYERIAEQLALPASQILFLSDVAAELDAARAGGLETCQLVRNERCALAPGHAQARDFDEVQTLRLAPSLA
jgi:enolase-phosphatase E1